MQFLYVNEEYMGNINKTVDAINSFFASGCKIKNFPTEDIISTVPTFLKTTIEQFNLIEPSWVNDTIKVENAIKFVKSCHDDKSTATADEYERTLRGLKALRVLQFIGDNYNDFSNLIKSIYTFALLLDPSNEDKQCVETFSTPIRMDILDDVMDEECYALDKPFFDMATYIDDVFNSKNITLNPALNTDDERKRIMTLSKWVDPNPSDNSWTNGMLPDENNKDNIDTVQEAAEVNLFKDDKNPHFKFDDKTKKFKISSQYKTAITKFMSGLKKCNTTDDLIKFFANDKSHDSYDMMIHNVTPFVITKVLNNTTKYPFDDLDTDALSKFIKSYKSIADKNNGAKRFINYDLFTVFKVDKEGTIKFINDFLTLELFNDDACAITNNTLLTLFNIFDSRIYLDILYNNLPKDIKKDDFATEDSFVKTIRSRINANSRKTNMYKSDSSDKIKNADNTDAVVEYVNTALKEFGDMSTTDMSYCEQYSDILYKEASTIDDKLFNSKMSPMLINEYMSSCKQCMTTIFQEEETGDIPNYMKNRISLSDSSDNDVNVIDYDLPKDAPMNPLDDVLGSIDAKMNIDANIDDVLGSGYNNIVDNKKKEPAGVVYNITNNYSNSFNKTTTTNDSSVGKTVNINKRDNNTDKEYSNNYNNSIKPNDTKVSKDVSSKDGEQVLSSGHTIQEVFAFLEAEEPLSDKANAGSKPKSDLLTTAMDADRKMLGAQQTAKKGVQKVLNTGKAIAKPFVRTKQWMTKIIDSLIKRDEDKVKAEIIENPSYRTSLYKAGRLALKLGLTGIAFTINGYLGAAYLVVQGAKAADKQRLKKEVQAEFGTELEILNEKIKRASQDDTESSRKAMYQMMRLRNKMQNIVASTPKQKFKHPSSIW